MSFRKEQRMYPRINHNPRHRAKLLLAMAVTRKPCVR